jgi:hypothetical protein
MPRTRLQSNANDTCLCFPRRHFLVRTVNTRLMAYYMIFLKANPSILSQKSWKVLEPKINHLRHSGFLSGEGPRSRRYGRTAALRFLVQPCDEGDDDDDDDFLSFPINGAPVEWNWQEKTEVLRGKTCPSATLSTTNPTWTDPGSKPGLRGRWPAANRLSYGTAKAQWILCVSFP